MDKEFNEDRKIGYLRRLWNKIKSFITGKTQTKQLESGDQVNSEVKKRGALKGISQFQVQDDTHENEDKIRGDLSKGNLEGDLAKKTNTSNGFREPKDYDLRETLKEEIPYNLSNEDLSGQEKNPEERIKGDLAGNSSQETSTEKSPQETSSFIGFRKPEDKEKDTDEQEL